MKSKQNIFLGAVVLLVLMAFAGSAQATTTLTVDDSGGADYLTITGALNVANDGDTIIVAAGTYAGFTVDEDVDVHGAQYNVDPEGALYRGASDDSDESVITGTIFLTADGATVNGFKLTSSYIAAGYPQAHDITISYNILENVGADWGAIHLHGYGTIDVHQCDGAYIGYNSISGAVGDGIWTVGNDDVTIEYNHILSSSGQASIQAINHVGTGIVIHGNTITDSNGKGINYWADNGGVITDNVITNSNNEAIFTDVQATISGNQITGTGGYGILVIGGAAGSIVSGNTISNPSYEGIQSDVQVSITNNDISGGSNGIQLSNAASGSVIDGNTISAPSWIGIKSFVPVDITNNNIIGGWGGIEILSGAGGSTMSGNTVSGTAAEAFRIFAQAAITNNDISGGYSGIGIWADGTVIDSNNIHDNQCRGVSIDSSVNNAMIRNNQLINNPYPGVTVWGDGDGSGIDINYNEITGNGIYGVESQRTISDVNAEYNWWGDASGPVHSTNPVGMGNAVSDNVDYSPWAGKITGPTDPVEVNTPVDVTGHFACDMVNAVFDWGDESTSSPDISLGDTFVTDSNEYTDAGVYTVTLTVDDGNGESITMVFQYVVVYDPEAGFVTGGGWIDSPEGAYPAEPGLIGKANFGFVSKYKKGMDTPEGKTQFHFNGAGFNFYSESYDWLVIAGEHAKYKGTGTIDEEEGKFGFMLTATDGDFLGEDDSDTFRIKIWDTATETVFYDNKFGSDDTEYDGTELGGGSIVIHTAK